MDLLRITFAACVLLSHAPEITDGNPSRELMYRLTHQFTFGAFGVDGFFLLSGYLIVKSWMGDPQLLPYLQKRVLRIVPGYLVAALLSTFLVGLLAPGVPDFFHHFTRRFPVSILLLAAPQTPDVFPGVPYAQVDGAMWTIAYEFRCYLLVALFGVLGLFRYRIAWLCVTVFCLAVWAFPALQAKLYFHTAYLVTGDPKFLYRMTATFLVGGCFYLYRESVRFTRLLAGVSVVLLVALRLVAPQYLEIGLVVLGGYLLFYLVSLHIAALNWMQRVPDISYGLYLYGWPVEMGWIWYFRGSPWLAFAGALAICIVLGWVSWEFVERPMLKLKRSPSARLTV